MEKDTRKKPIEEHKTAAWANIDKTKPITNVTVPSKSDVEFSREWVNENEK